MATSTSLQKIGTFGFGIPITTKTLALDILMPAPTTNDFNYHMTIHLRTWGNLACFTRPEMKVERVSYPVITPSAARGLLEAILYKPQFRWRIRRIAVKRPIRFLSFRRNEVKSRLLPRNPEPLMADEDRTQRNTLALRDVEYVIEASMHLTPLAGLPRREPADDEDHSRSEERRVGK